MSISPPWQHPRSQAHAIDRAIRGKCEDRAAWELCLEIPPPRADSPRPVSMHPISPPSSLHKFVPRNQNISFVTMSSGNSDTQAPGIAWYFDSEPDEYHPSSESEKSAFARQPWRAHWPPKSDKAKLAWMHSEFPEVLVWMFDRTKPFDRPWREWARSGIAMKEKAGNDATPTSCLRRLQLFLPEFSQSSNQRVRYLNIWRPITTPQQDSPLALCDYRSLNPETDLVAADIIFPHYRDEAYEVLHNPNQRWFYKKGMKWDDVILFKLGDSDPGEASLCPHSAFMDPSVPTGTPARRSIEVRAIIIG
ncbi:hypothetical protein ONS96_006834 [Cadophora gregata f. sp. sojae]|nr:hypothetical protein ONS96_006834 [Cadophora gregata f. sp. sojae]